MLSRDGIETMRMTAILFGIVVASFFLGLCLWLIMTATADEAERFWAELAKKIQDTSIRNLGGAIHIGLKGAVERKDINGVKFAAKMQLEVVDVLEQYFKRVYRIPAR